MGTRDVDGKHAEKLPTVIEMYFFSQKNSPFHSVPILGSANGSRPEFGMVLPAQERRLRSIMMNLFFERLLHGFCPSFFGRYKALHVPKK